VTFCHGLKALREDKFQPVTFCHGLKFEVFDGKMCLTLKECLELFSWWQLDLLNFGVWCKIIGNKNAYYK